MAPSQFDLRIVGHGEASPRDLVANPANQRAHPQGQLDLVRALLEDVGWVAPVIVNRHTGFILDGHARVELACALGQERVPVSYIDLDEDQERRILTLLDYSSTLATIEGTRLAANLAAIGTLPLGPLASALDDLATLHLGPSAPELPDPGAGGDEFVPEAATATRSLPGDLWLLGQHRLVVGDCRDQATLARLFASEQARLIWTDPPYGVGYGEKNAFLNSRDGGNRLDAPIANDSMDEAETGALLQAAMEAALAVTVHGAAYYVASPAGSILPQFIGAIVGAGWRYKHSLVWVKNQFVFGRTDYHYKHELVLYGWKPDGAHYWSGDRSADSVFVVDKPRSSDLAPTMKPLALIEPMLVASSEPGDIVFEPFAGSFSTGIAAERTGRRCYACELDPRMADICLARWDAESTVPAVLLDRLERAVVAQGARNDHQQDQKALVLATATPARSAPRRVGART